VVAIFVSREGVLVTFASWQHCSEVIPAVRDNDRSSTMLRDCFDCANVIDRPFAHASDEEPEMALLPVMHCYPPRKYRGQVYEINVRAQWRVPLRPLVFCKSTCSMS